jgi:hypothetical protein
METFELAEIILNQYLRIGQSNSTLDSSDSSKTIIEQSTTSFLTLNPILLTLGFGGSVVALAYQLFAMVSTKIKSKLMCSVQIKYDDDTFRWVSRYMRDKGFVKRGAGMTVGVKRGSELPWWEEMLQQKDPNAKPELEYYPGPGTRVFKHKG